MALTVKQCSKSKPGRLSDGRGLYLLTKPTLARSWVLRVQSQIGDRTKRRDWGLGSFLAERPSPSPVPIHLLKSLTLSEAREKARLGRDLAKAGMSPSEHWRQKPEEAPHTFEAVATECHGQARKGWRNTKHREEWLRSLERYAFPVLGALSVEEVTAEHISRVLLPFWLEKPETARRVKQRIGVILDHAHAKGWRSSEAPMRAVNQLMGKIKQPKGGNFAAMPHKDLPAFMATLREGDMSVGRLALQFLILTAARSGEVRGATWAEIDLEAAEWRVPPERMKAGKLHIVPLVPAAIDILKELRGLFPARSTDPVFPGLKSMMSDATMTKVLRVHGGGAYTVHGFRSTFRDWAADTGFADAWCEAAIAHANPNKTEAAYRRTTYFNQRRDKLMPAWASFALGDGSKVISLAEKRA
jgi:integrase